MRSKDQEPAIKRRGTISPAVHKAITLYRKKVEERTEKQSKEEK